MAGNGRVTAKPTALAFGATITYLSPMTDRSRTFDDLANLAANAAGALKGVGDEVRAVGRARAEKMVSDLDLVTREELNVLRARLDAQAEEIAALKAQLAKRSRAKS